MLQNPSKIADQALCERHNEKAYFLCIQQNCSLPTLICNECIQDDHAHISVPIKKLKLIYQQKSQNHAETDQLTNIIRSFYEDFKESILKTIEEDQTLFIKEICITNNTQLPESVKETMGKIKGNEFKDLKSHNVREAMMALEAEAKVNPPLQEHITTRLNSRKQFFENIKSELKGISLNNGWEFVTATGSKMRKGDKYILTENNNLIGNQILSKDRHRWKITFHRFDLFSCVGFGIADWNNLDRTDVSKNSAICCICCNGPWSGKSLEFLDLNLLKNMLSPEENSIVFEVDWINDYFTIYGPTNKCYAKKSLKELNFDKSIVPIVKNANNSGVEFSLETLL